MQYSQSFVYITRGKIIMATPNFSTNFDGYKVFDERVRQSGKTSFVFVNGIFVSSGDFQNKIVPAIKGTFNLTENAYAENGSNYGGVFQANTSNYATSVWFNPIYNDSVVNDWSETIKSVTLFLFQEAIEEAVERFTGVDGIFQIVEQFQDGFDLISRFISSGGDFATLAADDNFQAKVLDFLFEFTPFNQIDDLIQALPNDFDGKEALNQYWFKDTWPSSAINTNLVPQLTDWLKNEKNSAILLGHSQGNFFLEDALSEIYGIQANSRVGIIALGSPTLYQVVGGIDNWGGFQASNYGKDPVVELQLNSSEISSAFSKISHIIQAIPIAINNRFKFHTNTQENGDVNPDGYIGNDIWKPKIKEYFSDSFAKINPTGYYFPNGKTSNTNGTKYGDWIEDNNGPNEIKGEEGNDVLWGNDGNDSLIGGKGYDILNGGPGDKDIADYSSSSGGIKIKADKFADSDVYKVEDGFGYQEITDENGFGYQDILGNIEIISGSKFDDQMTGGDYEDIFYGQGGNDTFWGQKGNDIFYGGTG
ncbi:hypothetical protein ACE1CC_00075, partial [Aerosakkonemataceae cyanobacterium BLCC-F46]